MSDSLWPHKWQHAKPPSPLPTPGDYSNSCPLGRWCHPTISSVVPFSSCPQSLPASGSFPMSQLFSSGGQSTGVSAFASVLLVNTQDWSPLGWTGWIVPKLCPILATAACQAPLSMGFSRQELAWVAISFSRGSSCPKNQTRASCITGRFFTNWATKEVLIEVTWPKQVELD